VSAYAIATPERSATAAGARAFEAGGNAIDAALAAAATLAVTYPHMCGVGGDLFALVRDASGAVTSVNASGPAPALADPGGLGSRMPATGVATITVPGAVAGWERLHALGAARPWASAFEAAIACAADGFAPPSSLAAAMEATGVLELTEWLRQPALAATLRALAADGAGALYGGDVGARLAAGLEERGAWLRLDDLAAFAPELTPPLAGRFRDLDVLTSPPNSSGYLLLRALETLERGSADPVFLTDVFQAGLRERAASLADPRGPSGDTIAIVTADASGRAVSLIQSLFNAFGSQVLEPSTGIVLHNRGSAFTLEPGHPNQLAPGRRPAHTLMPVMVQREGALQGVLGTMGGAFHAQIHVQVLLHLLAGASAQEAVAAPRWTAGLDGVQAEADIPSETRAALVAAGTPVTDLPPHSPSSVGHAQAIWVAGDGTFDAGSDPRADGAALPS